MADITVPVPDDRIPEFYQFFGLWLAGSLSLDAVGGPGGSRGLAETSKTLPPIEPWGLDEQKDHDDAVVLWGKFSPRARALFELLIRNPGKEFTGLQIARECDIPNGSHGVAGVLAWPGRHGAAIGRGLPSEWREDPVTLESYYWMPPDRAKVWEVAIQTYEDSQDHERVVWEENEANEEGE